MRKLYAFMIIMVSGILVMEAQPTLTYPTNAPSIGDEINMQYVDYTGLTPGGSGAAVTWDYGTLTNADFMQVLVVDPQMTPYSASFPTADLAFSTGGVAYSYNESDMSGLYTLGFGADTGGVQILNVYSNMETMITYPFTYNSSFSDEFKGGFTASGIEIRQSGNVTVTGDAYGTIILPTGTFNNVLRVKSERTQIDSMFLGIKFLQRTASSSVLYNWYTGTSTTPLFSLTTDEAGTPNSAYYGEGTTGIDDNESQISYMMVYPNPATDNLTISYSIDRDAEISISILNQLGQKVKREIKQYQQAGSITENIDISEIPAGIYYVQVSNGDKSLLTQKLLIK